MQSGSGGNSLPDGSGESNPTLSVYFPSLPPSSWLTLKGLLIIPHFSQVRLSQQISQKTEKEKQSATRQNTASGTLLLVASGIPGKFSSWLASNSDHEPNFLPDRPGKMYSFYPKLISHPPPPCPPPSRLDTNP